MMATAACRDDAVVTETADEGPTRAALAPMPARVKFHPDVYALLARWLVEDLGRVHPVAGDGASP
jgi:hypothetical protein